MTTHAPYGPENAADPQDYPQFAAGFAQYPPAPDHYAPPREHPPVPYAQQGTIGRAEPVPYPQPGGYPQSGGYPRPDDHPPSRRPQPGADPQPGLYPKPPIGQALPGAATYGGTYLAYAPNGAAHVHQDEQANPSFPAYSTAPPWASTPQAPAGPAEAAQAQPAYRAVAPYGQPMREHGGLLVPYPDEMQNAARMEPPAVWPVALLTFLFGVFGIVSASRRAGQARRGRNSVTPYWVTFVITLVVAGFVWTVFAATVAVPVYTGYREGAVLDVVERNVVGDGQLKQAHITATAAQCRAVSDRGPDGMRDYLCTLTLDDGHTASLSLTADRDGTWKSRAAG
jgi:hypothetical protein